MKAHDRVALLCHTAGTEKPSISAVVRGITDHLAWLVVMLFTSRAINAARNRFANLAGTTFGSSGDLRPQMPKQT